MNDLADMNWYRIGLFPIQVEEAWAYFKFFGTVLNKHAPLKKIRVKNLLSPWFNPDFSELIHQKTSNNISE